MPKTASVLDRPVAPPSTEKDTVPRTPIAPPADDIASDPLRRLRPPSHQIHVDVAGSNRTRRFRLETEDHPTDPRFLPVPGLRVLEAVSFSNGEPLELTRTDRLPLDATLVNHRDQVYDTVWLEDHPELGPVLMRHPISNNGFWQRGHTFYVTGEWDGDAPAPEADSVRTEG